MKARSRTKALESSIDGNSLVEFSGRDYFSLCGETMSLNVDLEKILKARRFVFAEMVLWILSPTSVKRPKVCDAFMKIESSGEKTFS
jgi:hypothetical protein